MSDVNIEQSIFNIETDLEAIFMELEDNGGELTPELEQRLMITQENFENKVSKYVKAIRYYEDNVSILKGRKKGIDDLLKVRENRVKRLRAVITDAVTRYGVKGKSGNSVLELWDAKLFTRNTEAVELKEDRIAILTEEFFDYARELYRQGILETGEDIDPTGMLEAINAVCAAKYGENFVPFTMGDFANTRYKISFDLTPKELLTDTQYILKAFSALTYCSDVAFCTPKDSIKGYIKTIDESDLSIAELKVNASINIK
jgi:hypothetical protein